jgi:hypothetical protein
MKPRRCWPGLRPGRLIAETPSPLTPEQIEERLRKQDYAIQKLQTEWMEMISKAVDRLVEEKMKALTSDPEYTSMW